MYMRITMCMCMQSFVGRDMIFPILNIHITTCMTLPKQFAGAEIFAKRRKRSEKWVVDQEQPQTPNTPITPKTPTYPEKLVSYAKLSLHILTLILSIFY